MASAATFSFSPNTGSFSPVETFIVVVYVNPSAGEEITVAKLSAVLSPSMLGVVSFTQADGWMSPTSGQFDSLDNTAGTFEKMAGFPARVTIQKQFGTVTLKAKTNGDPILNAGGDSMILDIANADKYVASTGAGFTIATPTPTPTTPPPATPADTSGGVSGTVVPSTSDTDELDTDEATTTDEVATTTTSQDQTAAVVAAVAAEDGTNPKNLWYYIIAALVILAGVFAGRKWGSKS